MLKIPGKIPIRIYPFFWVLALVIGWLNSSADMSSMNTVFLKTALWMIVITFSVIIHEFGHALSAVAFGQRAKIDLVGFGGVTQRSGPRLNLWKEFIIVSAGPFFGLCVAYLTFLIIKQVGDRPMNMGRYVLEITFYVNAFWTIVNLLPVQPLDGGRLLSIIMEGIFGLKGVKIAYFLSILIAAVVGLLFFAIGAVLAGALFLILAFESYRMWQESLSMREQDQNEDARKLLKEAEDDFKMGKKQEAFVKFRQVRDLTQSGVIYTLATNYEATLLNEQGDYKTAYEILYPLKSKLDIASWRLLQQLAYNNQQYEEAIDLGNKIFSEDPSYEIAFINALSYAQMNQAKPAVGWLESAIREGMPNVASMLSKKEFDHIRNSPSFRSLERG